MSHGAFSVPKPLINSKQLAELLGMSRKALYYAIDTGDVPTPLKVGNRLRWRPEDIDAWLDDLAQGEIEFRGAGITSVHTTVDPKEGGVSPPDPPLGSRQDRKGRSR